MPSDEEDEDLFVSIMADPATPYAVPPVRSGSRLAGRCERGFWHESPRTESWRVVLAAKRYERAGKQAGKHNGPLGIIAIQVLELLANLVEPRTGRLEPSIATIACRIGRARSSVAEALRRLREHGFLDRLRRYVQTGHDGRGPQVQQTSNAYRLRLPEPVRRLLRRGEEAPSPPPDDHLECRAAQAAEWRAQLNATPLPELPGVLIGDTPLAAALARLGRAVAQRGSEARAGTVTESLS